MSKTEEVVILEYIKYSCKSKEKNNGGRNIGKKYEKAVYRKKSLKSNTHTKQMLKQLVLREIQLT